MTGTVDRLVELDRKLSDLRDVLVEIRDSLAGADSAQRVAQIKEEQEAVYDRQMDADLNSLDGDDWPIEVGDRIKLKGVSRYLEVVQVHPKDSDGWPYEVEDGGCWGPQDVLDVYTRAEQEGHDALMQIDDYDSDLWDHVRKVAGLEFIFNHNLPARDRLAFVSAEAAAALGPFTKIDEPIKVGDVVRWGRKPGKDCVFTVERIHEDWADGSHPTGSGGSKLGALTHVAREDPAYPGDAEPGEEPRHATDDRPCDQEGCNQCEPAPLASQRWDEYRKPAADVPTEPSPDSERPWAEEVARELRKFAADVREWCPGYKRMGITEDEKRCYCDVSGWAEERATELLAAAEASETAQ